MTLDEWKNPLLMTLDVAQLLGDLLKLRNDRVHQEVLDGLSELMAG